MRIRFLATVQYETEGPRKGPTYQEGSEHDFRDDIAMRWVNRGKAELVAESEGSATVDSKGRPKLKLAAKES